jgi:hypothetical protein
MEELIKNEELMHTFFSTADSKPTDFLPNDTTITSEGLLVSSQLENETDHTDIRVMLC